MKVSVVWVPLEFAKKPVLSISGKNHNISTKSFFHLLFDVSRDTTLIVKKLLQINFFTNISIKS